MKEYELYNEKASEFLGSFLSDEILETGDVITFKGESFFVFNLISQSDHKVRIEVWPAKIYLPGDIKDLRLLQWFRVNLIGTKIRLSDNKDTVEGGVTNYWPRIKTAPPDNLKPDERSNDLMYAKKFTGRLEFLILKSDDPSMIDLLDYTMIEILGKQG